MKRIMIAAVAMLAAGTTALAFSDEGNRKFREFLSGLKEAPQIVATTGTGTFKAELNKEGTEIEYELTFKDLESDVRQAHIHLGYPQNSGNIVLWLCDSAANNSPVATTPACQADPLDGRNGTVSGILTAADVILQVPNGSPTWDEIVELIKAGRSYVNVHTATIGAGEIRSQIDNHDGHVNRH